MPDKDDKLIFEAYHGGHGHGGGIPGFEAGTASDQPIGIKAGAGKRSQDDVEREGEAARKSTELHKQQTGLDKEELLRAAIDERERYEKWQKDTIEMVKAGKTPVYYRGDINLLQVDTKQLQDEIHKLRGVTKRFGRD
tara:strand:+ start:103 stop:516 length:414 start_codon:yes stop_codon:yes gene_type:complete